MQCLHNNLEIGEAHPDDEWVPIKCSDCGMPQILTFQEFVDPPKAEKYEPDEEDNEAILPAIF